jgi:hypothetical protein
MNEPLPDNPLASYLRDILRAVDNRSPFCAIALTLALPDICGSIEYPQMNGAGQVGARYRRWCDEWARMVVLSGADCYALRCAYLHSGLDEFSGPAARSAIFNRVEFTSGTVGGVWDSRAIPAGAGHKARIPHEMLCRDMTRSAEGWRRARADDSRVAEAIAGLMRIQEVIG